VTLRSSEMGSYKELYTLFNCRYFRVGVGPTKELKVTGKVR